MKTTDTLGSDALPRGDARSVSVILLWCLLGLLLPRAALYGEMAPFGIGLAAAIGAGRLPVMAALMGGYLLAEPVTMPLRYVVTVAVVGGARWVVAALPELERRPFVPPVLSFVSTAVTGLVIFGQTGLDGYRVVLILAESVVAAGSALFFATAIGLSRRFSAAEGAALTAAQQTALIFTAATIAMAAATVEVGGFSPGRAVVALLILALARSGREAGGCMAGCVLGSAMALATPAYTAVAVALALGGLLAGAFSRFGRTVQAGVFFITAGVVTLTEAGDTVLLFLYELLAAGVVFVLLPRSLEQRLAHLFIRSRDMPAVEGVRRLVGMRLRLAAGAIKDVGQTVESVSRRLEKTGAPSPTAIYQNSSRTVCEACPLCALCWEQHGQEMLQALDALTPRLQQEGAVTEQDLLGYPGQHCRCPDKLVDYINRSYEQYLAREGAWQRLRELQSSVQEQFAGTGTLLSELAADLENPRQVDMELSHRVLAVCEDFGMPVHDALCVRQGLGRLTVDILTTEEGIQPEDGRWLRQIQQVCGRPLAAPVVSRWGGQVRVTLTEPPAFTVELATAQRCCDGESLCGDAVELFDMDGRTVVVLSDGMGSGGRAAVDGAMAAGLTARLWQAGFRPEGILQTVNAALLVKDREESLATLDIAVVDTFSGRLDSYKAGAVTTLLRSAGRVSRLERPSLPLGILPQVTAEHSHDRLVEGDVLLLVSDGALSDGVAAVELLLGQHEGTMQDLADRVADAARAAQVSRQGDITLVGLRLTRPV